MLQRGKIAAAALELVGNRGYQALTMSAVARELGVSPSALYNHVESKQQLLQWIQELVMARVESKAFHTQDIGAALRAWATSYRNVFAAHAPLIPVIAILPVAGSPNTLLMYEEVAAGMDRAGWPRADIVPTIVALESFIFGSALDATAPLDIFDPGPHSGSLPIFEDALRLQRESGTSSADSAFLIGLEVLVNGLISRFSPAGGTGSAHG